MKTIKVKVVNKSINPLPEYTTPGAAGMDVRANLVETVTVPAHGRKLIPTGLYVELPDGYELQVRPRSGLALKKGITVLNTPGTVDSDYRGEIGVILFNTTDEDFAVEPGDRIAQMVINEYVVASFEIVEMLSNTDRADGGWGHSDIK